MVQRIAEIGDDGRALTLFNTLETIRLTACIKREFPGLAREILALDSSPPVNDATWQSFITKLESPDATVADTVAATAALYPLSLSLPAALAYQGELDLDAAKRITEQRIDVEKNNLQRLLDELLSGDKTAAEDGITGDKNNFELTDSDNEINDLPELKLDGEPLPMPPELARTVASLLQDLEQLPEDWLTPAGDAEGYDKRADNTGNDDIKVNRQGAYIYDEWDFRRASYRKNWCALREINAHPLSTSASDEFIENTLTKHRHLVREIRRHFEALRGEDKLLKAQPDGEDIDLDALVTAHADMQAGREVSSRLFTRKNKIERGLGGTIYGRCKRLNKRLDQRRRTRKFGVTLRSVGNARRPIRHLRILRHDAQPLRSLSRQKPSRKTTTHKPAHASAACVRKTTRAWA